MISPLKVKVELLNKRTQGSCYCLSGPSQKIIIINLKMYIHLTNLYKYSKASLCQSDQQNIANEKQKIVARQWHFSSRESCVLTAVVEHFCFHFT